MLPGEAGIDYAGRRDAEIGEGKPVLAQKIDAKGVVVDDDELLGLLQRTRFELKRGNAADRDGRGRTTI